MGFRAGLEAWKPFLRPGGVLAVSESTWLRPDPPKEIRAYRNAEHPEIATLERAGYDLLGDFVLPPTSWIDTYYGPTEKRIPVFLDRHADQPEAAEIAKMERQEAHLYERYHEWCSYGFYVARTRHVSC